MLKGPVTFSNPSFGALHVSFRGCSWLLWVYLQIHEPWLPWLWGTIGSMGRFVYLPTWMVEFYEYLGNFAKTWPFWDGEWVSEFTWPFKRLFSTVTNPNQVGPRIESPGWCLWPYFGCGPRAPGFQWYTWRFRLGVPIKNVITLVVTGMLWGAHRSMNFVVESVFLCPRGRSTGPMNNPCMY